MTDVSDKDRELLRKLHAQMGSENDNVREIARSKIKDILTRYKLTWNDIPELIQPATPQAKPAPPDPAPTGEPSDGDEIDILALMISVIRAFVDLRSPHQYLAVALWTIQAHQFRRFTFSPRLALLSPVRRCGKTTLLIVLERLLPPCLRADGITPAAVYWAIDAEGCALLIDEADNLNLQNSPQLRGVFNSGHRQGGFIPRVINGETKRFSTYAPLAIGAIGSLPLPLIDRSILIDMQRTTRPLEVLTWETNEPRLLYVYGRIRAWWEADPVIARDPELPATLRVADNWRAMVAIADAVSPAWGAQAREAAIWFAGEQRDEDAGVQLLSDIRDIFDARGGPEFMYSESLVDALNDIDDAPWSAWCGVHDNRAPRRLTQADLAKLLKKPFKIGSQSIWPRPRLPGSKSRKGYRRNQFAAAWAAYCPPAGTPAQGGKIKHLRSI